MAVARETFWNVCLDKGRLKQFLVWFMAHYGMPQTVLFLDQLKEFGFGHATRAGISLGIDDLIIPPNKAALVAQAENESALTTRQYASSHLTGMERYQRLIQNWHQTSEILKEEVIRHFESAHRLNPVYMMAFSGARGNISQVRQLVGMRGLMSDPQGQILDFPIRSNFREGLTLTEYIISCYGARKGIVDTALRTANAGYLTRRLVDVAHHVVVSNEKCQSSRGVWLSHMKEGRRTLIPLSQRLVGRVLAKDVYDSNVSPISLGTDEQSLIHTSHVSKTRRRLLVRKNREISPDLAATLAEKFKRVYVRSPLTCANRRTVCRLCYGWSLASGKLVSIGEAVGVVAAQSIGEPGTQLTMRTFHTGGVFSSEAGDQIKAPHAGEIQFENRLLGRLVRTADGRTAFFTKDPGLFKVVSSQHQTSFKIPSHTVLFVRHGQTVDDQQILGFVEVQGKSSNRLENGEKSIYADLEGEFRGEKMKVATFKNNQMLKVLRQEYAYLLAGQIYDWRWPLGMFAQPGDRLTGGSFLNVLDWHWNRNVPGQHLHAVVTAVRQADHSSVLPMKLGDGQPSQKELHIQQCLLRLPLKSFDPLGSPISLGTSTASSMSGGGVEGRPYRLQSTQGQVYALTVGVEPRVPAGLVWFPQPWPTMPEPARVTSVSPTKVGPTKVGPNALGGIHRLDTQRWLVMEGLPSVPNGIGDGHLGPKMSKPAVSTDGMSGVDSGGLPVRVPVRVPVRGSDSTDWILEWEESLSDWVHRMHTKHGRWSSPGETFCRGWVFDRQHVYVECVGVETRKKPADTNFKPGGGSPMKLDSNEVGPPHQEPWVVASWRFKGTQEWPLRSRSDYHAEFAEQLPAALETRNPAIWVKQACTSAVIEPMDAGFWSLGAWQNGTIPVHIQSNNRSNTYRLHWNGDTLSWYSSTRPALPLDAQARALQDDSMGSNEVGPQSHWETPRTESATQSYVSPMKLGNHVVLFQTSHQSPYAGEMLRFQHRIPAVSAQLWNNPLMSQRMSLVLTSDDQRRFRTASTQGQLGDFISYGHRLDSNQAMPEGGQLVHRSLDSCTVRRVQPIMTSTKALLHCSPGDFVRKHAPVMTLPFQRLKAGDIVQGIPKIEQFFEARSSRGGRLFRQSMPNVLKALFRFYEANLLSSTHAVQKSLYKIQQLVVDGVLRVYRSQGVSISDKHIEIIVRQMTLKVEILSAPIHSGLFQGERVNLDWMQQVETGLAFDVRYRPVIVGITQTSLEVEGFLSSASFQHTTRTLTRNALYNTKDFLKGLKEQVIVGRLISAGTAHGPRNLPSLYASPMKLGANPLGTGVSRPDSSVLSTASTRARLNTRQLGPLNGPPGGKPFGLTESKPARRQMLQRIADHVMKVPIQGPVCHYVLWQTRGEALRTVTQKDRQNWTRQYQYEQNLRFVLQFLSQSWRSGSSAAFSGMSSPISLGTTWMPLTSETKDRLGQRLQTSDRHALSTFTDVWLNPALLPFKPSTWPLLKRENTHALRGTPSPNGLGPSALGPNEIGTASNSRGRMRLTFLPESKQIAGTRKRLQAIPKKSRKNN